MEKEKKKRKESRSVRRCREEQRGPTGGDTVSYDQETQRGGRMKGAGGMILGEVKWTAAGGQRGSNITSAVSYHHLLVR